MPHILIVEDDTDNLFIPVKENILLAFNIVLAISAVWFFVSYRVAVKVYQKRDIT